MTWQDDLTTTDPTVLHLLRETAATIPDDRAVIELLEQDRAARPPRKHPSKAAMLFGIAAAMGVPLPRELRRREKKVDPPYTGPKFAHVEKKGERVPSRRERKAARAKR